MKKAAEQALAHFNHGYNCAQTVLSAFNQKYGLDDEAAARITGGLGGGFRSGEICGAVSGAVLVIGLKYGQKEPSDAQAKQNCNLKTEEFIEAFRARKGAICCRDVLGCDLSKPGGREWAAKLNLFDTVCADAVKSAILLLEELGY